MISRHDLWTANIEKLSGQVPGSHIFVNRSSGDLALPIALCSDKIIIINAL